MTSAKNWQINILVERIKMSVLFILVQLFFLLNKDSMERFSLKNSKCYCIYIYMDYNFLDNIYLVA